MNGRKAAISLCMLCALLGSGIVAQSAGAITGTTAFTCKEEPTFTFDFKDRHCKEVSGGKFGKFNHVFIAENTTTELAGNNSGEVTKLKTTVGGVAVTLSSTSLSVSGTMENKVDITGEHYSHGEGTGVYTGVTVSVPKCFVYRDATGLVGEQGTVETEALTGTTTAQGDAVKFTPRTGELFARFWILDKNKKTSAEGGECFIGATYFVTGSVTGTPEGATIKFTHEGVTTQNTLKMGIALGGGSKAGLEGRLTLEGTDPKIVTDVFKPLSATTVATE